MQIDALMILELVFNSVHESGLGKSIRRNREGSRTTFTREVREIQAHAERDDK